MPRTKSAKKALRQSSAKRAMNLTKAKALKEAIKTHKKAIESGKEAAQKTVSQVYKAIDKAAKTNLIKKNKANRLKSAMVKNISK